MRAKLHPDRYLEQMSVAQNRVEAITRLPPGRRQASLQREFEGIGKSGLLHNRAVLGKLEAIMVDWKRDGRLTYDAEFILAEIGGHRIAPLGLRAECFGQSVTYVHFGPSAGLTLAADDACHIDGMYFYPTYRDGESGLDVAFVCDEPTWDIFGNVPYGKAISTASRTAIVFLPFAGLESSITAAQWVDGDAALMTDAVMVDAYAAAEIVLTVVASLSRQLMTNEVRLPFRQSMH